MSRVFVLWFEVWTGKIIVNYKKLKFWYNLVYLGKLYQLCCCFLWLIRFFLSVIRWGSWNKLHISFSNELAVTHTLDSDWDMFPLTRDVFAGSKGSNANERCFTVLSEMGCNFFVIKKLRHEDEFQITAF